MDPGHRHGRMSPDIVRKNYWLLALNLILSLAVMYLAMFSMIWGVSDFFHNLNMFYMALIMWAPMGVLMLATMGSMYSDRKLNVILYAGFALVFALALFAMRDQSLIGDRQFLRSMIPHHSGAILMCEKAPVADTEIRALCGSIIQSQKQEIDQMKVILRRLD